MVNCLPYAWPRRRYKQSKDLNKILLKIADGNKSRQMNSRRSGSSKECCGKSRAPDYYCVLRKIGVNLSFSYILTSPQVPCCAISARASVKPRPAGPLFSAPITALTGALRASATYTGNVFAFALLQLMQAT